MECVRGAINPVAPPWEAVQTRREHVVSIICGPGSDARVLRGGLGS
jgi:hypothetical protein